MSFTRRNLFATVATAAVSRQFAQAADDPVVIAGKRPMILHSDRPEDLETPVRYFDSWVTPIDAFFVRQHLPRPGAIDTAAYRLTVNGMVSKPLALSLADLGALPQFTVPATLECTGNGRGFYSPKIPGIQWMRGAIGNAEWRGPRVSDVLKMARANSAAAFLETDGADTGIASTPDFVRSLPMAKALHPATILALSMNGQTPAIHGFPVRLIVPGWYALPPGTPAKPAELEVIEGMPVKSCITAPEDQSTAAAGPMTIRGFAWAGENAIERVEVSVDGGSRWREAQLSSPKLPFAWRLWSLEWQPGEPGYYTVMSRATDTAGRVQPIVAPWNPSGYLWNAIDRVGVIVEKSA
jgi:DMSO/TMAO reductase YedYZ molybdopterin-dependent catalytic subunit